MNGGLLVAIVLTLLVLIFVGDDVWTYWKKRQEAKTNQDNLTFELMRVQMQAAEAERALNQATTEAILKMVEYARRQ